MLNVNTVHNEVYNLLIKHWQKDSSFRFTFRKSNRESRLDKGYWFYGNEWYLAVSFWTGMDWKNKTPNIIFIILLDSGNTYLEINTSDSDEKRRFITQFFVNELELQSNGIRYQKHYQGNYLESLENFIKTDKILIDNIISENAKSFFSKINNGIFFIEAVDFEGQKEKIDKYRENILIENSIEIPKPIKISEIDIFNYGPIKSIQIDNIPFSSQWIFFTGENGTGKTSILRAIATAICNQKIQVSGFEDENAEINLKLFLSSSETISYSHPYSQIIEKNTFPLTNGFAAYGQSRLKTTTGLTPKRLKAISTHLTSSLFDDETYLIDLQYQFDVWRNQKQQRGQFNKRKNYITEILTDILPNLYDIKFDDQIEGVPVTTYIEKDHEEAEFAKVTFNKLASGLKSMIAMIGDILIRLYNQQPDVNDPSEFTGIVLIDEIDIHLHPKLQKQIVQQLTKTFPKVQFIVSTHSPISFLGAPKNSQIFRVERNSAEGVNIRRLDELLELGDLLPNTILTSPIFGLDDIIPESHDQKKLVRTETNYSEIEFNDIVQMRISSFLTDEKEQKLIDLFKSRRQ
ncbi:MAG: AAA family ATPase [Flavobacterium lindanitolerans]|uniref:AAA family ATPase n=1 Tax=Flavobacterium lindanitolerans TaxID=428988 RepID=UPI001A3765A2|nr:AAA family ATPase [Flavobacterium lindanitolerans]MBL7867320.1 AAA family ATPase [Flavobacterium lindanitolerans]